MLAETDGSGNPVNEYIYFDGMRIARRDSGGSVYYSFGNELGSPTITTATGSTCYDADFYPFGGEHAYTNTCAPNQKFAGMEQDSATGLYRTIFRQYAANNGRWLSPDPYAGSYDLTNPQSMNRYAYVGNMPMSYIDPYGLDTITIGDCQGESLEGGGYQLDCNAYASGTPFYTDNVWEAAEPDDLFDASGGFFGGGLGGFGDLGDAHPWGNSGGGGGGFFAPAGQVCRFGCKNQPPTMSKAEFCKMESNNYKSEAKAAEADTVVSLATVWAPPVSDVFLTAASFEGSLSAVDHLLYWAVCE